MLDTTDTATPNYTTTNDIDHALDIQMARAYNQDFDRLAEILGIFSPEVVAAGTAMYLYEVTGNLNSDQVGEGEEVKLSKYTVKKKLVGEHGIRKYRKATSAETILRSGYENSVIRTDKKMNQQARAEIINNFFSYMAKGTGAATGDDLQGALAFGDAALADAFEKNGDEPDEFVHFVNRQDVAGYLAKKEVTLQTVFGMDYLQNFLGVKHMFITSKVPAGNVYITTTDNIHVYGVDFSALEDAGLVYEVQENSLIGVHHNGAYDHAAAETHMIAGCDLLAEILDYIVIASFGSSTASIEAHEGVQAFDPTGDIPPTVKNKVDEINAWAEAHNIDLSGCKNKDEMIAAITAALGSQE